ncbi:MAG: hypothetical protein ABIO58_07745 [Luteimonas sp.]
MSIAMRPEARPYWLILNVGVKVNGPGVPTSDFELIDTDGTGLVIPDGDHKGLKLSGVSQPVLVVFTLEDNLGLHFPPEPDDGIGIIRAATGCPTTASNATAGMFDRKGVSKDQRRLAVLDQNPGSGHEYRFALFLLDSVNGTVVAVCDPKIINN